MPDPEGPPAAGSLAGAATSFAEAWDARDPDGVAEHLHPRACALWLGRGPIEGREAIHDALAAAFTTSGLWTRTEVLEVVELVQGQAGYTTMAYTAGRGDRDDAPGHQGKAVAVWARAQGGAWRVRVHSSSPDDLAPAPG